MNLIQSISKFLQYHREPKMVNKEKKNLYEFLEPLFNVTTWSILLWRGNEQKHTLQESEMPLEK